MYYVYQSSITVVHLVGMFYLQERGFGIVTAAKFIQRGGLAT